MNPEDERFVRSVIARETIRRVAAMPAEAIFVRPKPAKNITENIPATVEPGWSAKDSVACWDEYIAMCRERHLHGDPVPAFFRSTRERGDE